MINPLYSRWSLTIAGLPWVHKLPDETHIEWLVDKRQDGYYWYTGHYEKDGSFTRFASFVGPFSNWMAAAADCECAHKEIWK